MIGCLMIHGYTGGPHEVGPLADYLREHTNWHVDVPTLPGHGQDLALKHVTYKDWLLAAEDALVQLKESVDTVYLIGFSMGGMIAAYLAAKYKIDKLVLLAASRKYLAIRQMLKDAQGVAVDAFRGKLKQNMLFSNSKRKLGSTPFKAYIEFLKLVRFSRQYLHQITAPVLIAHGQRDMMVPYQTGYYLDKEIKSERKEVVLFAQSDHMICLGDDYVTLNQMVHTFLTK